MIQHTDISVETVAAAPDPMPLLQQIHLQIGEERDRLKGFVSILDDKVSTMLGVEPLNDTDDKAPDVVRCGGALGEIFSSIEELQAVIDDVHRIVDHLSNVV